VVATSEDGDTKRKQIVGDVWSNAEAGRRVLAVGDHEVGGVTPAKLGHRRGKAGSARTANDVGDEQDAHGRGA